MNPILQLLQEDEPLCAPLALNALMARLAEAAGFRAVYLGGGAMGYEKAVLEANLNLSEMVQAGVEIRAACALPLILDAAAGWGDPMHMHRTVPMAEAAGFAAIEIEDQLLPKRAHHHVGIEHMIPQALMEAKLREAAAARREGIALIARSNAVRASDLDDALRRGEAYRKAGADVLLLSPRTPEEARHIGERLEPPLATICTPGGLAKLGLTPAEMHALGFRLLLDTLTPLLAAYEALGACYRSLAGAFREDSRSPEDWRAVEKDLQRRIGLERLLEIEKATVEEG